MIVRRYSKWGLAVLLLLAVAAPVVPFGLLRMFGAYSSRDIVFFGAFAFSLICTGILFFVSALSFIASLRERKLIDCIQYFGSILLCVVPLMLMLFLLAQVQFLINPG